LHTTRTKLITEVTSALSRLKRNAFEEVTAQINALYDNLYPRL